MEAKECKRFDGCSAPLCPMDENDFNILAWYADEEICPLREFCKTTLVKTQTKIARKTRDFNTYYTHRMLQHSFRIGKAIYGIDSETEIDDIDAEVEKWITEHPEKRIISESEKEKLRNNMAVVRRGVNPTPKTPIRIGDLDSDKHSV